MLQYLLPTAGCLWHNPHGAATQVDKLVSSIRNNVILATAITAALIIIAILVITPLPLTAD